MTHIILLTAIASILLEEVSGIAVPKNGDVLSCSSSFETNIPYSFSWEVDGK